MFIFCLSYFITAVYQLKNTLFTPSKCFYCQNPNKMKIGYFVSFLFYHCCTSAEKYHIHAFQVLLLCNNSWNSCDLTLVSVAKNLTQWKSVCWPWHSLAGLATVHTRIQNEKFWCENCAWNQKLFWQTFDNFVDINMLYIRSYT